MRREELQQVFMNEYKLAANFCRTAYAKGGVCIYVHKCLETVSIDIENCCKGKDFEACAIKLNLNSTCIYIITTYRAPSGNFNLFINKLDTILRKLCRVSQEERAKLRESVPYVKLYRYNPKHLYPKLNGFRDNGK